ncbi:MAG: hypothetical protein LKF96_07705 [Treponema sp.]|jgi:ribonucleoside-triphosphate reductase|nr:hypothetical protein [Treponema sp.]
MEKKAKTLSEIDAEIATAKEALAHVHGTDTEVYARIVGYYRAVRNWNKGKRDEFNHRKMFTIEDSGEYAVSEADQGCSCSTVEKIEKPVSITAAAVSSSDGTVRYELYARRTCPNCPPVKAYMAETGLRGTVIDVDSKDGLAQAAKQGVFAAPTVIFYDAAGNETARGHNVEELAGILEPAAVAAAV